MTLVQGPPGTGKTSFLVNTLLRIVEMRREKVKRDYGRQEQKAYEERRFLEEDINHVDTKLWEGRVLYVNNLDFGINDDRLREGEKAVSILFASSSSPHKSILTRRFAQSSRGRLRGRSSIALS